MTPPSLGPDDIAGLAQDLLDGSLPATAVAPDLRLAVAWELKDRCYAAWASEPQQVPAAAAAVRGLQEAAPAAAAAGELEALARWTHGIACLVRGEMAAASDALEDSAAGFRSVGADAHAAQTQVPRIMALAMLGRHEEAAACAASALRAFIRLGDTGAAGKVALNLGSLHLRRDEFAAAAQRYREAAVLFARAGDREHSVMADVGLAGALTSLGDFGEARLILARAAMRSATHGLPVVAAIVEESIALLELTAGDLRVALAAFEGCRRRYEQLAMPQPLAIAEKQLGDAYLELNLVPEALAQYESALASFRELAMPDDAAWTLVQLGRGHARIGHVDEGALALAEAAQAFARTGNQVGRAAVALAEAEHTLAAGGAARAADLAATAADAFAEAGFPERRLAARVVHALAMLGIGRHADAGLAFAAILAEARATGLALIEVRARSGIGLVALAQGDEPGARTAFGAAVTLFEDLRRALPGDELRSAFLDDHLLPYRKLLELALADHAKDATQRTSVEVLIHLDRVRALTLGERLAGLVPDAPEDPCVAEQRTRLHWLYRRLRRLQDEGASSVALHEELRGTERRLLEQARRGRLAKAVPSKSEDAPDLVDVGALQSRLAPADALVEYGVAGTELFACVVRSDDVVIVRNLADPAAARAAVQAVRFQMETLRHGANHVARHLDALRERAGARLRMLHDLLWAPLETSLAGATRVMVVPCRDLAAVPYAALQGSAPPVGERVAIACAPSAYLALRMLRREAAPPAQLLAVAESTRLPYASEEASAVARLYPSTRLCAGPAASLASVAKYAPDADVFHLACHGQFRSDNPAFSALHLADGPLTGDAIQSLSLRSATVVLSACETALADPTGGDEMFGLVRAFLAAGAARVVASLWPVDDQATAAFMVDFHGALAAGVEPALALQHAQRQARSSRPHPFYWSAFTLFGRW